MNESATFFAHGIFCPTPVHRDTSPFAPGIRMFEEKNKTVSEYSCERLYETVIGTRGNSIL